MPYCTNCPDHEACFMGVPCEVTRKYVKPVSLPTQRSVLRVGWWRRVLWYLSRR